MNDEYNEHISNIALEHIKQAIYDLYKAKLKNKNNDFIDKKIEIAITALETINFGE